MATELAKAYVQIIPSTTGIKGKLTEALGGEAASAGKESGISAGSAFGSALKSIVSAGVSAIGGIMKSSIEGFADYEQLVGGVETLFKDSAGIVREYASNAFQTAGLSANDYMETVTSFSASLLQSLDGDTAAAAQAADMAISDMSDNANKMGSSMESIQTAYQGFAKQNYTMLDNLKLGYGGTKSEMERLLADASKLSGVKYDISNLSDVYEAIHIIQTELDITGTTAKEASTTISGSIGSLSAAWSNLLTGLSDGNADLSTLIGDVVYSAETVIGNLLPVAEQALGGIGSLVEGLAPIVAERLPGLVETLLPQLIAAAGSLFNSLASAIPSLVAVLSAQAPGIISGLVSAITENAGTMVDAAIQIILALADGLLAAIPPLLEKAPEIIAEIVSALIDNVDKLVDAAIEIILALADGLISSLPKLLEKAPEIVSRLVDKVIENAPKLLDAGLEIIVKLGEGVINALGQIAEWGEKIINSVRDSLSGIGERMLEIGDNIVKGIWSGISSSFEWIKGKIEGWIGDVVGFFKRVLGISSPSKVFAELGGFMAQGLGLGMDNNINVVRRSLNNIAQTVKDYLGFSKPRTGPLLDFHSYAPNMMDLFIAGIDSKLPDLKEELTTVADIVKDVFDDISSSMDLRQDIASLEYSLWEKEYDANNYALKAAEQSLEAAKEYLDEIRQSNDQTRAGTAILNYAEQAVRDAQERYDSIKAQADLEKYAKKQEMLNAQLEEQVNVVNAAGSAFQTIIEKYGEGSEESLQYLKILLQEQNAYADLTAEINNVIDARNKLAATYPAISGIGSASPAVNGKDENNQTFAPVFNVYGAAGQDVRELAQEVNRLLTQSIRTKEAAWA